MSNPFWISDGGSLVLRYIDASGVISTPALTSSDPVWVNNGNAFIQNWGMTIDPTGANIYVVEEAGGNKGVIYKINTTTFALTRVAGSGNVFNASSLPGVSTGDIFHDIHCVVLDAAGNLYVSDTSTFCVIAINTQGNPQTLLGVNIPAGNAAIVAGTLNSGGYSGDSGPAIAAQLSAPYGLAFDLMGNLYIADQSNNTIIRKVSSAGVITTVAGTPTVAGFTGDGGLPSASQLNFPLGVAFDVSGNLYITDSRNFCIRAVNNQATTQTLLNVSIPAGDIKTVAGIGTTAGFSGDGGQATLAHLGNVTVNPVKAPWQAVVDSSGVLYIADTFNFRIRKVLTSGVISTIAGNGTPGNTGNTGPATSAEINTVFGMAVVSAPPPGSSVALFKLNPTQPFDEYTSNTAINSTYCTYGFVNSAKAAQNPLLGFHRKRYSEIQMYIKGTGQETTTLFPNYIVKSDLTFNPAAYSIPPIVLQTDPSDDIVRPVNSVGNRVYVMYSTNAVGAAFNLSKTIMIGMLDGWNTVNPNAG